MTLEELETKKKNLTLQEIARHTRCYKYLIRYECCDNHINKCNLCNKGLDVRCFKHLKECNLCYKDLRKYRNRPKKIQKQIS